MHETKGTPSAIMRSGSVVSCLFGILGCSEKKKDADPKSWNELRSVFNFHLNMAGTFLCFAGLQYEDALTDSFPALDDGAHWTTCTELNSIRSTVPFARELYVQ